MSNFFDENATGDNLVINLEDVDEKSAGFEAMPKGTYGCIIEDVDFGYSQSSDAPMITFKYKVTDAEYENRLLFHHCVLNKNFGVAMLKKVIVNSGVDVDMAKFDPQKFADEGDAIGLPINVVVGIQKYKGEKRNNVKDVKPSTETGGGFF